MSVIELTQPMDDDAFRTIQFFRERLAELERNWSDLGGEGFTVSGWVGLNPEGRLTTTGTSISTHRLKGLYIDFRFFWGENEPSNFHNMQALIGKHCRESSAVKAALKYNKQQWIKAGAGEKWHGLHADEMISAIFYGSIIHQAEDKQASLQQVNSVLSAPAAHYILTSIIWARTHPLRSLDWMLSPLRKDQQIVQVPDCFT